jgi:carbonic anhydrase/acetyltransferase-like protein (isoleucine patch superfamily)
MALILPVRGINPKFGENCFFAENATIVGEVEMGAIVMDHAIIETGSIVAAGAVILENTRVESGYIYGGMPARKIKKVGPELGTVFEQTANNYIKYAEWFK